MNDKVKPFTLVLESRLKDNEICFYGHIKSTGSGMCADVDHADAKFPNSAIIEMVKSNVIRAFLAEIPYFLLINQYNTGCTHIAKWDKYIVVPMTDMGAEYTPIDNMILCSYTSELDMFKGVSEEDVSLVDIKDILPEHYHQYLNEESDII